MMSIPQKFLKLANRMSVVKTIYTAIEVFMIGINLYYGKIY